MTCELYDSFAPVTRVRLCEVARALSAQLPEDYESFLLSRNGGLYSDVVVAGGDDSESRPLVKGMLAVDADETLWDLMEQTNRFRDPSNCYPKALIPIGRTGSGDICLAVTGSCYGSVFATLRDQDSVDPWENVAYISESFASFFRGLTLAPERPPANETHRLFVSVETGDYPTIESARETTALLGARNERGMTLLMAAAMYCRPRMAETLLGAGLAVDLSDEIGRQALHVTRSVEVADMLIRCGANVNARDKKGETPLFNAVRVRNRRIVRCLIANHASVHVISDTGRTLLDECNDWLSSTTIRPIIETAFQS